jgi:GT2 family glycosyltransferase
MLSVSVVMPTFAEPDRLETALRSLAQQDYPRQAMEILVVDDASPVLDAERLYAAAAPFSLQLLRHPTNQGRARARNTGLRAATGELVVFLDSDMTVEPDFLRIHAEWHQTRSNAVLIGNIRFAPQLSTTFLSRYLESRGVHRQEADKPLPFKCFVTGNSSLRRELLMRVGLFDEDFSAYGGEDLELGYRLELAGASFHYAPRALSYHHHIRPLESLCCLMYAYGQKSIPLLVGKHPEVARVLRLDFLQEPVLAPRRLLLSLALLPMVYWPIYLFSRWGLKYWVPDLFFDYILWYNRTRGYLAGH